jgi:type IV pilus assembly protein PilM
LLIIINIEESALLEDPVYQSILHNNLLAHLRHTMQFFFTSRPNIRIQKLILSGDFATIPSICAFIQKEIGIETAVADLSSHLTFSPKLNPALFNAHAPSLVLACGLALTDGAIQ